jgi:sugar phosphate isomerase/epimerase
MKSAITVSLVPEARGGPFVFWDDFPGACQTAKRLGFDAVELFAPGPDAVPVAELTSILAGEGLALAAIGTGAGWVKHKLSLTSADAAVRTRAIDFIRAMIDYGAACEAPAIIGSMQGRWGDGVERAVAIGWLGEAIERLSRHAGQSMLIYEPLNRYETNLFNRLADIADWLRTLSVSNVKVLADLFHMNIEEAVIADSIRDAGTMIGHVHWADSNRHAAGFGHTDFQAIYDALNDIAYDRYLSAEVLPLPDSDAAAKATIESISKLRSRSGV